MSTLKAELTEEITEVDEQIAKLKRKRERTELALATLERNERERYPAAPDADSVLVFELIHDPNIGKEYRYAAIKAGSKWYTTGSTCPPQGFTWKELVQFVRGSDRVGGAYAIVTRSDGTFTSHEIKF